MRRSCIGLAALCFFTAPALADGPGSAESGCGGDAYSFAEVVPAQRGVRRHGPIMVMPDTLCADLAGSPATRIESLNVFLGPGQAGDEGLRSRFRGLRPAARHY
jgi:hypothetical protein